MLRESNLIFFMKTLIHNSSYLAQFNQNPLSKYIVTNYLINRGEIMDTSENTTAPVPQNIGDRANHRLFSFGLFLWGIFKNIAIFVFGIFLGMGIVLKNPPEDKKSLELIKKLNDDFKNLNSKYNDLNLKYEETTKIKPNPRPVFGDVLDSIIIKN